MITVSQYNYPNDTEYVFNMNRNWGSNANRYILQLDDNGSMKEFDRLKDLVLNNPESTFVITDQGGTSSIPLTYDPSEKHLFLRFRVG